MKNYFTIIPGISYFINYLASVRYKLINKNLLLGFNCELKNVNFGIYNSIGESCSLKNSKLENYTYISRNSRLNNCKIGKFCSIGPNCQFGLGMHPTQEFLSTHPMFYSINKQNGISLVNSSIFEEFKEIKIGNDVWIGANVIILDGFKIGSGSIIAAGTIVNRDVEEFEIVAGVPCKHIKFRFDEEMKNKIIKSNWWNESLEQILKIKNELDLN